MKPKQSLPKQLRYTVAQFNAEFPNDDAFLEYIKEQRWICERDERTDFAEPEPESARPVPSRVPSRPRRYDAAK
jgi:hypothetical protein